MDIGATRLTLSDLAVNATITEVQHVGQPCALSCAGHCVQGLVVVEVIPALALKFEVNTHQHQGSASPCSCGPGRSVCRATWCRRRRPVRCNPRAPYASPPPRPPPRSLSAQGTPGPGGGSGHQIPASSRPDPGLAASGSLFLFSAVGGDLLVLVGVERMLLNYLFIKGNVYNMA